jgi:hypothetical protein
VPGGEPGGLDRCAHDRGRLTRLTRALPCSSDVSPAVVQRTGSFSASAPGTASGVG